MKQLLERNPIHRDDIIRWLKMRRPTFLEPKERFLGIAYYQGWENPVANIRKLKYNRRVIRVRDEAAS